MPDNDYGVFTEKQFEILMQAACAEKSRTNKELYKFYQWATKVWIANNFLESLLNGECNVKKLRRNGEPTLCKRTKK